MIPKGREIRALGHEVRLMPASYVKPYVKRGKTDAADAEAFCEAVTRPSMRFVPIKTAEQNAVLMPHRTRDLLVRQRTMLRRIPLALAEQLEAGAVQHEVHRGVAGRAVRLASGERSSPPAKR